MGLLSFIPGVDMISSFLNPGKGYKKGQEQLDKYYQQSQGYLQPYNQQGQQAYGHLNTAMQNLLNPAQLNDQFASNYQTSNLARMQLDRAMYRGNRAASSMGLMGSSPALQALQAGTNEIGAQDEQRYMDRMIQQYLQGAGLAQNVYGMGAQAGGQMGQNAMNMGGESANMAYGQQNAPGQMFGSLLGTAAGLGGSYMGMKGMQAGGGGMQNAPWNTRG
jgi:hypothetical protein